MYIIFGTPCDPIHGRGKANAGGPGRRFGSSLNPDLGFTKELMVMVMVMKKEQVDLENAMV